MKIKVSAPYPWDIYSITFERHYMKHLRRELNNVAPGEKVESICTAVPKEVEKIFTSNTKRILDKPGQRDILMASYVLASYCIARQHIDDVDLVKQVVGNAFCSYGQTWVKMMTRLSLFFSRDKMKTMVDYNKKAALKHGKNTVFEEEGDGILFHSINVKQCGYHEFFKANGAPELTKLLCPWDNNWADEIKPDKHGIEFSRPTTIAKGDDMCRFQFRKVDKKF